VRAWLDEALEYFQQAAADPCSAFGHACRCPVQGIERLIEQAHAEREAQVERFRRLFATASPSSAATDSAPSSPAALLGGAGCLASDPCARA
jgi:hypothetical protein